jgi:hypothetical protein
MDNRCFNDNIIIGICVIIRVSVVIVPIVIGIRKTDSPSVGIVIAASVSSVAPVSSVASMSPCPSI